MAGISAEASGRSVGDSGDNNYRLPPRACDLLIEGDRVLDLDASAGVADGVAIAVAGDQIVDVGRAAEVRARWVPARRLDATGHVNAPGFVDAHVHLGAYLYGGRPYVRSSGPGPFSGASGLHHLGIDHPVPALALHARADDVATVIVDGRVVVEEGQLVTCGEEALIADARSVLERRRGLAR